MLFSSSKLQGTNVIQTQIVLFVKTAREQWYTDSCCSLCQNCKGPMLYRLKSFSLSKPQGNSVIQTSIVLFVKTTREQRALYSLPLFSFSKLQRNSVVQIFMVLFVKTAKGQHYTHACCSLCQNCKVTALNTERHNERSNAEHKRERHIFRCSSKRLLFSVSKLQGDIYSPESTAPKKNIYKKMTRRTQVVTTAYDEQRFSRNTLFSLFNVQVVQ